MNLFDFGQNEENGIPLAYRLRPQTLDEVVGQRHLVGPGSPLRRIIEEDRLHSFILYGPPGTGKTTLALIIAKHTRSHFEHLKAVSSGVTDLRKIAEDAEERLKYYKQRTVLFVDEIHRFNKGQQDVLLPHVESGLLTLIGATTENPLYEINSALLSRMKIYMLEPLTPEDIRTLIYRALVDKKGLGGRQISISSEAVDRIVSRSKGDARVALNLLETTYSMVQASGLEPLEIKESDIDAAGGQFFINYDKKADGHYDTISAFIKSVRGSDPDAALFWLAVMIQGGEDPLFIARRLVILAAEDIGLADPQALPIAVAAFQAAHFVGMPEARIPLAEATIYLACAPKSNSSKVAIDSALDYIKKLPSIKVPPHIADSSHPGSSRVGKGSGYKYPHDYGGYVAQRYLAPEAGSPQFYKPCHNGKEVEIKKFLEEIRRRSLSESR